MSDPAVEAADRVREAVDADGGLPLSDTSFQYMEDAAREALYPIRELHAKVDHFNRDDGVPEYECAHCDGYWPCPTAKLVYSAEELL